MAWVSVFSHSLLGSRSGRIGVSIRGLDLDLVGRGLHGLLQSCLEASGLNRNLLGLGQKTVLLQTLQVLTHGLGAGARLASLLDSIGQSLLALEFGAVSGELLDLLAELVKLLLEARLLSNSLGLRSLELLGQFVGLGLDGLERGDDVLDGLVVRVDLLGQRQSGDNASITQNRSLSLFDRGV